MLFEPDPHTSLSYHALTRDHLILNLLHDVRSELVVLTPSDGQWQRADLPGVPEFANTDIALTDSYDSDEYMILSSGFTEPGTLRYGHIGGERRDTEAGAGLLRPGRAVGPAVLRDLGRRHPGAVLRGRSGGLAGRADPAHRLRRLRGLADPVLQRGGRARLARPRRHLRGRQPARRRRVRPAVAHGRDQGEPALRLRGLRRGRGRPGGAGHHHARAARHRGRQQRRPADGRDADPLSGAVRRDRHPGAAARHAALPRAAGRGVLDGRVRRPARARRSGSSSSRSPRTRMWRPVARTRRC